MGVTYLRPYFMQIIGHNSVNVQRIPTKLNTEIRLNEPLKCAKFQLYWSTNLRFMVDFAKCANISRTKKNPNFGRSYLGNGWNDFLQIWNVDSPT